MTSATGVLAPVRGALRGVGALAAVTVVAALLAFQPMLAAGVVLGSALVYVTVSWPLLVIGTMLVLAPIDLAFVTGGFKGLFPQLGGLDMNGIRLVGVTGALALVVATDRELLAQLRGVPARWYVVFLAWATISLLWSRDPFEGVRLLARTEGILPALEPAHAVAALGGWLAGTTALEPLADDAIVLLGLSGRGDKDLAAIADRIGA